MVTQHWLRALYFYAPEDLSPTEGSVRQNGLYVGEDDKFTLGAPFITPTTTKAASPAPGSQGVGQVAYGKKSAYMLAPGTGSSSKIRITPSSSLLGPPVSPTTGNRSTFDVRYWDTNPDASECVFRSGFRDGCDAWVVGDHYFSRHHMVGIVPLALAGRSEKTDNGNPEPGRPRHVRLHGHRRRQHGRVRLLSVAAAVAPYGNLAIV